MTDARFPERWLNDRRVMRLSDAAFRLFVVTLTWSVANRTEGVLYDDDVALLPGIDPTRTGEIEKHGLWRREGDRWRVVDFEDTQTTRAELESLDRKRRLDRERKARQRAREGDHVPPDVPPDVTRDGARTVQARPGQARHSPSPQ